jgi:hypothetical protein
MSNQPNDAVQQPAIRDILFGDLPFSQWPNQASTSVDGEPWLSFISARDQLDTGNQESGKQTLRRILEMPDLESRHYLQAWHFLRELGESPADGDAKRLYGVVVEVALDEGLDIVAAYADHTARYLNYSGAAIVWERPDESLDQAIDSLLAAGRMVVAQIGPWEGSQAGGALPQDKCESACWCRAASISDRRRLILCREIPLGGPVIVAACSLCKLTTRT